MYLDKKNDRLRSVVMLSKNKATCNKAISGSEEGKCEHT